MEPRFDQLIQGLIYKKFTQNGYVLEPEVREELKWDIARQLDDFIQSRAIAALSDRNLRKYKKLKEQGKSRVELSDFADRHIPGNFERFLEFAMIEFEEVYLEH